MIPYTVAGDDYIDPEPVTQFTVEKERHDIAFSGFDIEDGGEGIDQSFLDQTKPLYQ